MQLLQGFQRDLCHRALTCAAYDSRGDVQRAYNEICVITFDRIIAPDRTLVIDRVASIVGLINPRQQSTSASTFPPIIGWANVSSVYLPGQVLLIILVSLDRVSSRYKARWLHVVGNSAKCTREQDSTTECGCYRNYCYIHDHICTYLGYRPRNKYGNLCRMLERDTAVN